MKTFGLTVVDRVTVNWSVTALVALAAVGLIALYRLDLDKPLWRRKRISSELKDSGSQ